MGNTHPCKSCHEVLSCCKHCLLLNPTWSSLWVPSSVIVIELLHIWWDSGDGRVHLSQFLWGDPRFWPLIFVLSLSEHDGLFIESPGQNDEMFAGNCRSVEAGKWEKHKHGLLCFSSLRWSQDSALDCPFIFFQFYFHFFRNGGNNENMCSIVKFLNVSYMQNNKEWRLTCQIILDFDLYPSKHEGWLLIEPGAVWQNDNHASSVESGRK